MPPPRFTILIDGACHLCAREARLLTHLDKGRNLLAIRDISDPSFDPSPLSLTHAQLMGQIHGVTPEGGIVTGMEVFRRSYAAVGKGWLLAWTALPLVRPLVDLAYRFFARHRLRISALTAWLPGARPLPTCPSDRCAIR